MRALFAVLLLLAVIYTVSAAHINKLHRHEFESEAEFQRWFRLVRLAQTRFVARTRAKAKNFLFAALFLLHSVPLATSHPLTMLLVISRCNLIFCWRAEN